MANGLDNRKQRGRGSAGPDLPNGGLMGGIGGLGVEKSFGDDATLADAEMGYCAKGSIAGECGSNPAMQAPGQNNKGLRIPHSSGKGGY